MYFKSLIFEPPNSLILKSFSVIFIAILFFLGNSTFAQDDVFTKQNFVESFIENIAEDSEYEIDYTSLLENLLFFYDNPINLNSTNKDELAKLQFLNEIQINNLLQYIIENGNLYSEYEILLIDGYSRKVLENLLPFIIIFEKTHTEIISPKKAIKYGNNQVLMRSTQILEEQVGYSPIADSALAENPNSRYLGSPIKIYTRYKFNYHNKILFGITAEKDNGEEFFQGSQKNGFDYYSGFIQLNNIWKIKTLVIGDFETQFGQGLCLWSGLSFYKSIDNVNNIKKNPIGIKKYSSVNENNFQRGVAATFDFKKFSFTAFFSRKKIDANIAESDTIDNEILSVSSFQTSGYHRTYNELEDKHANIEQIAGANLTFLHRKFKSGITLVNSNYSAEFTQGNQPYQLFDFSGKQNSNIGIDYQYSFKNLIFFGETAISQNLAFGSLNGVLIQLNDRITTSVLHRKYEPDYQALNSNSFSESSDNSNENGIYFASEIFLFKNISVSAYFDTYSFPWLKHQINLPSKGSEYSLQCRLFHRNINMYFRYKHELKPQNLDCENQTIEAVGTTIISKFRYHISYEVAKNISLRNRIEYMIFDEENKSRELGYLLFQDIRYQFSKTPLSLVFRYAIFDTESWNSRIYTYENDVLYAFSVPAFYSKGTRTYLLLKYSPYNKISFWLRLSRTYYSDKETIGSGLDEIDGNTKTELKMMCRIKF